MKKVFTVLLIAALAMTLASCSLIGPRYPSARTVARYYDSYQEPYYDSSWGSHHGGSCHRSDRHAPHYHNGAYCHG